MVNWLLDFRGALNSFYDDKIKGTFENKSTEYKELFDKHLEHFKKTQQALVAVACGIFALVAIAYFWPST